MAEVVDSDELLRRIQRARDCARQEKRTWRTRSEELRSADPEGARDAAMRAVAHGAVLTALEEILTPGKHVG
ncbi:hypothetical protein ACOBQB_01050 [Streptomyces sp. G5(2025)]|uniref:hypothetical protein n=1 Tax=Streptomyces sp. G5(2025) TaxID=3406628 RepID=UPI003C21566D